MAQRPPPPPLNTLLAASNTVHPRIFVELDDVFVLMVSGCEVLVETHPN